MSNAARRDASAAEGGNLILTRALTAPRDVTHVLIAGLSTRAVADSALRAGFTVTTIDAFADLDVHPAIRAFSLRRDFGLPFSAHAAAVAASDLQGGAAVYVSNFENDPEAVSALAIGRVLWGNPPSVLQRVRNPRLVAEAFRARGVPAPQVCGHEGRPQAGEWLIKPLASGGGRGVRKWLGERVHHECYLQQHVDGVPGSVVFVAAGGRAVPLGVTRQLVGDDAFGASGYRYCGNMLMSKFDSGTIGGAAASIASAVAQAFDLVGVNGVDFIEREGQLFPIEVNPRWCASMELVERAYGVSVFGAHAAASTEGTLPVFDLSSVGRGAPVVGKAIVFARRDVMMGDTSAWLDDPHVRDVPRPGERIAEGHPICTVLADGADAAACYDALVIRANGIYGSGL